MHERIKKLRKTLDLTQREFGERIGVKPNTIATYEIGRNEPIDAVISLICREFNVNETWLRTGEGDMFVKQSRDDELKAAVNKLLSGESSDFKSRLVNVLSSLSEDQWVFLQRKMEEIVSGKQAPADPAHTPTAEERARARMKELYPQILLEEEQADESSASQDDTGSGTGKMA